LTTFVLTPNAPNPLTGFANPVLGWQLTIATALDALTGCNIVFAAGWIPQLTILATSSPADPIWQLILTKTATPNNIQITPNNIQIVINDTDYLAFDGQNVFPIPQATVVADYTVTTQAAPTAPTTT
jgi:hypothetical protein